MRILAAALTLALSAPALAEIRSEAIEWTLDGTRFSGHLVHDDADDDAPGLVMVPNWMGVNDSAVEKARQLAGRGYAVLVADVYGVDVRPTNAEEAGAAAKAMYADREMLRARAAKAVDVLQAQAERIGFDAGRIGAIGFCFGGATVLELARSGNTDVAAVVSFHGGLDTSIPAAEGAVEAGVLVLNGAADSYVSDEDIDAFEAEMSAAGADWVFVNYADAVHCFAEADASSPPGCVYHERSAKRAYRAMDDFLSEQFGG